MTQVAYSDEMDLALSKVNFIKTHSTTPFEMDETGIKRLAELGANGLLNGWCEGSCRVVALRHQQACSDRHDAFGCARVRAVGNSGQHSQSLPGRTAHDAQS